MTQRTSATPVTLEQDAPLEEVAAGIFRLNLPVPFKGLRQINLWLLRDGDDWLMIDCGWGDDASRAAIKASWDALPGGGAVTRLLITHFHPDHVGNSRWIAEHWGLVPLMSDSEWSAARQSAALEGPDSVAKQSAYFLRHGLSEADAARYRTEFLAFDQGVVLPDVVETIAEGDTLSVGGTDWTVITGGGHSPEMVTLHATQRGVFIAGDQLLPKISSNVSIGYWNHDSEPLREYLASLARMRDLLVHNDLVLPSHGEPFNTGAARAAALIGHHDERLDQMAHALEVGRPMTIADFMPVLFSRSLDGTQIGFAMGEVAAHLNHLIRQGRAVFTTLADGSPVYVSALTPPGPDN